MTQPIQEPNIHRALAGSKWSENQLFRRPQVTACCDYPYVFRLLDVPQTISAGAPEYVSFTEDDFEEGDNFFDEQDAISVGLRPQAVYDFFAGVHWDPPFNSVTWIRIECQQFAWMPTNYGKGGTYNGAALIDQDAMNFIHFQARMLGDLTDPAQAVALVVAHENSASQDIDSAFLRISKLYDWTSGTGAGINGDGLLF